MDKCIPHKSGNWLFWFWTKVNAANEGIIKWPIQSFLFYFYQPSLWSNDKRSWSLKMFLKQSHLCQNYFLPRGASMRKAEVCGAQNWAITVNVSYPWGHLMCVRVAMVIVENKNSQHHTAGHHALDEVEVGPCRQEIIFVFDNVWVGSCYLLEGLRHW